MRRCTAHIFTLLLLVLPLVLHAQEGGWVAVTRLGDTLRNVHLWGSGESPDSLFSFERASINLLDETHSVVSSPVAARWVGLRDVVSLTHERSSSFWIGAAVGGGLGIGGDIALHARNKDAPLIPVVAPLGAIAGGLLGELVSIDENYRLSYLPLDDVRAIATARLPHARRGGKGFDGKPETMVTAAGASLLVSRESLWLVLGALGGGYRQQNPVRVAAFGGLNYRLDQHLLGVHYINSTRGDQLYEDISLHYGRAFPLLGGEGYLSAGPGYAWAGEATTRTDTGQSITRYSTASLSALFQQQWFVTRWLGVGAGLFVGTTARYPFGGGMLTVSFGDLD